MHNMSQEEMQKIVAYKNEVKLQAEFLILHEFPRKILELNDLLKTKPFTLKDLNEVHSDLNIPIPDPSILGINNNCSSPLVNAKRRIMHNDNFNELSGSKVYLLPSGSVPSNKYVIEVISLVKPHLRQLVEDTNVLKMWISFLIPKIEDGNNFGVSVQEDSLGEIRTVESEAAAFYDQIARYFLTRGKLISKVARFPHIDDYRRTVEEIDEKEILSLRLTLIEVRNHYASLQDMITKNLEKIRWPRTDNSDNMY